MSDLSIVVKPFYVPAIREPRPSIFTRVAAAVSHYRTGRILAAMDDRTLADIGASRSEAIWEDSRPIWERLDTLR